MENPNLPKILLVMDDDVDESQVRHILVKYRFANGLQRMRRAREAVRLFNDLKGRDGAPTGDIPQLIIFSQSDAGSTPPASAFAAFRNETGNTPIIFVASSREEEENIRALNLPRTYCLGKPLGFFKLLEAMQKLGMYWMVLEAPP